MPPSRPGVPLVHRANALTLRILVVATAVSAAAAPAYGQQPQQEITRPESSPPAMVDVRGPVDVPLLATPGARVRLPVVEVMVNGRGPFRFGIETGARFLGVSRAFADSLGLRAVGAHDELREFRLDSVALGGAVFYGVPAAELPRAAQGVDGVLGLPVYQDLLLTIDYPRGRLRLSRDSLPAPDGRSVLALRRADDFWAVPITLAGRRYGAIVDTRSMSALSISPAVAESLTFDGGLRVVGRAGGAGLPTTEVKAGQLAGALALGRYAFPHPTVTVHALPPGFPAEPLLGAVVLQNFVVTLDQRHGRLRLEREGGTEIELPRPAARREAREPEGSSPARK